MSIETWVDEFAADEVDSSLPILEQIRRERRLLVGLHEDNLKRHDVFQDGLYIREESKKREGFKWTEAHICSLFWSQEEEKLYCKDCPLYNKQKEENCSIPYDEAANGNGPGAMIALINKAEKAVKFGNNKR